MIRSRLRTTIWLGLEDDGEPEAYNVHSEDDMLMIETVQGDNDEVEVLISPKLFPRVKAVIAQLENREQR